MNQIYQTQDRGNKKEYRQYLEAMDTISMEKVASASVFFDPKEGNTIVDVGMASGTSSAILAELFPQLNIVGVDINPRMVEIARSTYKQPNLSFREDDGETLHTFEPGSVNGFFNCSSIHHITSYNGYDNNKAINTIHKQIELLRNGGIIVIRDFVKPEEREVVIELSVKDKPDRPNDPELLLRFSHEARSLANPGERGFPLREIPAIKPATRRFRLFLSDATEFIRRKDYFENWEIELQEEYGYFSQKEFEQLFHDLGLRIILSSPIYNRWIINNRYKGEFCLFNLNGCEIGYPPTNYLIAGEKISASEGKHISLIRHLPHPEKPFLAYSSHKNKETHQIYDLVSRPNEVTDLLPYWKKNDEIFIWAKAGYPRPLAAVENDNPVIDGKRTSGYINECLTVGVDEDLQKTLYKRFGFIQAPTGHDNTLLPHNKKITTQTGYSANQSNEDTASTEKDIKTQSLYNDLIPALRYYTSPGGINERVSSVFIQLTDIPENRKKLVGNYSGFKEAGFIQSYNARQLINTAQTGALPEARLELNIYHLFSRLNIRLPKWLGEKPKIQEGFDCHPIALNEIENKKTSVFDPSHTKAGFLKSYRACFAESGREKSSVFLEYVYPEKLSSNTLLTLPVNLKDGILYAGLEVRDLPVPQNYTGNSRLITVPAKRLPKEICNMFELEKYIRKMRFGDASVNTFSRLGEKYFPSIGITTEQVYPYVVTLDSFSDRLTWVKVSGLFENAEKLEDAHLLICLFRLKHMLESL